MDSLMSLDISLGRLCHWHYVKWSLKISCSCFREPTTLSAYIWGKSPFHLVSFNLAIIIRFPNSSPAPNTTNMTAEPDKILN
jgi:hypothetical protein